MCIGGSTPAPQPAPSLPPPAPPPPPPPPAATMADGGTVGSSQNGTTTANTNRTGRQSLVIPLNTNPQDIGNLPRSSGLNIPAA